MKLNKLTIKNYRCFSNLEIDFHPELTVIVAHNGGGKTAILDAIAVAFGPFIGAFDEAIGKHFDTEDVRRIRVRETQSNEMESQFPLELIAVGDINGMEKEWRRELNSSKGRTTTKNASIIIKYGKDLQEKIRNRTTSESTILPIISYYGTGRLWNQKRLTERKFLKVSRISGYIEEKSLQVSRTAGYTDCLEPSSSYKSFAEWFRYASIADFEALYKAHQSGNPYLPTEFQNELNAVREAVNICLSILGWENLEYSSRLQEIVAKHPHNGILPISLLSDGIRNMIGLVADIAYRIVRLNPQLGINAVKETPGIVLIDEVDMHLHPEWQQVVIGDLRKAFPNIQFIITTHSPQVLTTVLAESIRKIDWDNDKAIIKIPEFSYGFESNQVLESIQEVDPRPPQLDIVRQLKRYLNLVSEDLWDSPEAQQLRSKLDMWSKGWEPELIKADMDIRMREYRRRQ
jgi:predicted ATP-binding protein involved in virulence